MSTILLTGGTGMIGKAITRNLIERNHELIILTRKIPAVHYGSRVQYALWDIRKQVIDKNIIARADYIIHLAGANVAEKRWTGKRKKEIVESRVESGRLLARAVKEVPNRVKAILTISGIGWYGPDPVIPNPQPFTEEAPAYDDFLAQTCKQWEGSLDPVIDAGIRLVKLRTGLVMSSTGGALKEFAKPVKLGIAASMGSGKQVVSWIHIDDLVDLFLFAMENEMVSGVYNAVAPQLVSNEEIILGIARAKRGKLFIPVHVPVGLLKLLLGEMSIEVIKSATVSAVKIQKAGFEFQYRDLLSLYPLFKKV